MDKGVAHWSLMPRNNSVRSLALDNSNRYEVLDGDLVDTVTAEIIRPRRLEAGPVPGNLQANTSWWGSTRRRRGATLDTPGEGPRLRAEGAAAPDRRGGGKDC